MKTIPNDILDRYLVILKKRAVPVSRQADYKKWLRYFLDFRSKYSLPDSRSDQVRLFIQKLRDKKQTPEQQKQAAHAVSLFFESQPKTKPASMLKKKEQAFLFNEPARDVSESLSNSKNGTTDGKAHRTESHPAMEPPIQKGGERKKWGARFNEWRCLQKSSSPDRDKLIDGLAAEIKTRHYSRKTLKTYADWIRKFQSYLKNKPPDSLSSSDVKAYLTFLAVNCKVAASTQNQASMYAATLNRQGATDARKAEKAWRKPVDGN